ncbi:MAG: cytochrome c oxidase assembly protein [Sporichthyaceae bacterium]
MLPLLLPAHPGADVPSEPLSGWRYLTAWSFEPLPLFALVLSAGLYLFGVRRMQRCGNPWPLGRTLAYVVGGHGALLLAVASPLATYDVTLLSVHMAQHMLLAMIGPIFLVLGAPITLALRTLPLPWRRRLLAVLHSRIVGVFTFPAVAGAIFVANPFVLYFSGLYEQTLEHAWLHDLNHLHFVMVGCLWFGTLIGVDPLPNRAGYPLRVISAFVTLPFHAWLGVSIMSANTVIAADWYASLDKDWGASPLSDQKTAGGIVWISGDVIGLLVFAALFFQWVRASEREARREDRRLDRLDAVAARAASSRAVGRTPRSVASGDALPPEEH